jgi:hypothetical protein
MQRILSNTFLRKSEVRRRKYFGCSFRSSHYTASLQRMKLVIKLRDRGSTVVMLKNTKYLGTHQEKVATIHVMLLDTKN